MNLAQNLIKVFYKYNTHVVLVTHKNKIISYIKKVDINMILSDLAILEDKKIEIPQYSLSSLEKILEVFQKFSQKIDDTQKIPILNIHYEFIDNWSLVNIIENYKKDSVSQAKKSNTHNEGLSLSILEELPFPMLAFNIHGETLFYNEDWILLKSKNIKKKTATIQDDKLFIKSKQIIGDEVIKKQLNKSAFYTFTQNRQKFFVKLIYKIASSTPIGYLIWIIPKPMLANITKKKITFTTATKKK